MDDHVWLAESVVEQHPLRFSATPAVTDNIAATGRSRPTAVAGAFSVERPLWHAKTPFGQRLNPMLEVLAVFDPIESKHQPLGVVWEECWPGTEPGRGFPAHRQDRFVRTTSVPQKQARGVRTIPGIFKTASDGEEAEHQCGPSASYRPQARGCLPIRP